MAPKSEGAKNKLRAYLLANVGKVLDSDELRNIAGISEWARRIRELRDDEGYQILTHNDRASLKQGQYLLETEKPAPAIDGKISKELRALILDRNGFTCQMCGAVAGEPHQYDTTRKTRLHIGHIVDKSHGGKDEASNLRALCSVCNEGSSNITPSRPEKLKILTQLRRCRTKDQIEAMKWLIEKFPSQARELTEKKSDESP